MFEPVKLAVEIWKGYLKEKREKMCSDNFNHNRSAPEHNYIHHTFANIWRRKVRHETEAWNENTYAMPSAVRQ